MIRSATRLFLCAFVLSTVVYGDAATTLYGTTAGQPFFNRPAGFGTLSGEIVRFQLQPFVVNDDATCVIESIQEAAFDGMIFLYRNGFDAANPLANLVAFDDDDGEFGEGTSRIDPRGFLLNDDYFLVTAGFDASEVGTFSNQISCAEPATRVLVGYGLFGDNEPSDYDGRRAQLLGGRFEVSVTGFNFSSVPFVGRTVPLASNDSAVFWFFQPANFELLIKLVDGCFVNNRYWVYYAATSNVEFTVRVADTFFDPPIVKTYRNPLGTQQQTSVADTNAFANCN